LSPDSYIGAVVFFHVAAGDRQYYGDFRARACRELAVLKAIGYPDRYVLFFVLSEALVVALIGGINRPGLAIITIRLSARR